MLHIKKEEARELLQKMRQVKKMAGEAVVLLEHMIQLYSDNKEESARLLNYNPDDYIERIVKHETIFDAQINSHNTNYDSKGV